MALTQTPNPPTRVFIDSSVLIAAAISQTGTARHLLTAGLLSDVALFFSDDVFEETERNLTRKFPTALPALRLFQEAFVDQSVQPREATIRQAAELVAAKDAPILGGAIAARVQYLATFDQQHLLSAVERIQDVFGITVATPSEILRLSGERSEQR
jgi:predicted nucleic acid-binding protein